MAPGKESVVKNLSANAGDSGDARDDGSVTQASWVGNTFGVGNRDPLKYSCLKNPMDRGAWWAPVYKVAKNQLQLSTHLLSKKLHLRSIHNRLWTKSGPKAIQRHQ